MRNISEHLTNRVSRARVAQELKRGWRPSVIVVAAGILASAAAVYIVTNVSKTAFTASDTVRFAVSDATGVVAGEDQARVQGIPVGSIANVTLVRGQAVLTVTIEGKYGPIYRNARAELRPNTPLQDMYLDIVDRGTPSAGAATPASVIPASQTDASVNISNVLDVFKAPERAGIESTLTNLGHGLADRGAALRTAFVDLVPFLQVVGRISDGLSARSDLTAELVHNARLIMAELARRNGQLRTVVTAGAGVVSTVQRQAGGLNATLVQLPPTLTQLQSTLASVERIIPNLNNALVNLAPVARELPHSLDALRRLAAAANPALQALEPPVHQLVPLANGLLPLATRLDTAVTALQPQAGAVNHATIALADCPKGVQGFFQWDASMTKFGDVRGPAPRGNLVIGLSSNSVVQSPFEYAPTSCAAGVVVGGRPVAPGDEH
jgi:ABC-type transporter Mla subunit MlaD